METNKRILFNYRFQKLQRRFCISYWEYRIIVKDKRFQIWKEYAKSCFEDVINEVWEGGINHSIL